MMTSARAVTPAHVSSPLGTIWSAGSKKPYLPVSRSSTPVPPPKPQEQPEPTQPEPAQPKSMQPEPKQRQQQRRAREAIFPGPSLG